MPDFDSIDTLLRLVREAKDVDSIRIRAFVDREAHRRGVKLSVGEIGEKLAIEHFVSTSRLPNLVMAPTGTKNVDALSRDGDRYSIKTIQRAKKTGTVYPDGSNPDKQLFEFMLVVVLNDQLQLTRIYQFTWLQFLEIRAWDRRMNAWYVPCSKKAFARSTRVV